MLFTIVFDEVGTLDTTDIKTAFQACGLTHLVSAVLNAETKEVLYGELPDWMLSPEETKARAEKEELARKRAWADKQARDALKISGPESKPAIKVKRVGGITRADKPIAPWCRPAEASQQYVDAIGPSVTPSNWNFTVVVLYDYEPAWVGRFHGEDVAFDFFEQRVKNKRTVMLYKGSHLVCRAFNGVKEAQQ